MPKKYTTPEDVIGGIRRFTEIDGRVPCPSKNRALRIAALEHFNSWEAAVEAAGFKYKRVGRQALDDIDRALLDIIDTPLKSAGRKIPAKCQQCYWRDGHFCPFVGCFKNI